MNFWRNRLPGAALCLLFFPASQVSAQEHGFRESDLPLGTKEWQVSSTLTMPTDVGRPVPAVLLVPGSGPADRDVTVGPNRLFRDIAHAFAQRGIATVRFDKRLMVHHDLFVARHMLPTLNQEYLDDAVEALGRLEHTPGVDPAQVYVLGHSQGATFAADVAKRAGGTAGIIVVAGSTRKPGELIEEQARHVLSTSHNPEELQGAREALAQGQALSASRGEGEGYSMALPNSYWRRLYEYDAGAETRATHGRVLIVAGGRDNEVNEKDVEGFRKALAGRPETTIRVFPSLNHLMQEGTGPSSDEEYVQPNHGVSPDLLRYLADWITRSPPQASPAATPSL